MSKQINRKRLPRRGVLLIVVLSLLVLFALIGLTFVVVAGHYSTAARISILGGQTSEQGPEIVDQVFYDFLRGTNNASSPLFRDDDDSDGTVDEDIVNGTDDDMDGLIDEDPVGKNVCSSLLEDLYGTDIALGTVATLPSGSPGTEDPLRVNVTITTGFKSHLNAYNGRVITFLNGAAGGLSSRIVNSRTSGANTNLYVVPFQPPGATPVVPSVGSAFIINGRAYGSTGPSADESYDAPDRLNPHLAFIPVDAPTTPIIPSFVDRIIDLDGDGALADLDDLVIDNDGDGLFDSGWIDPGFEVKTAADGRRYKAYASILCIDLDGRFNLNSHGNLAQLSGTNYSTDPSALWAGNSGSSAATGATFLPRGMGFGPADVNLSGLLSTDAKHRAILESRYGSDQVPGITSALENLWLMNSEGLPRNYFAYTPATGPNTTCFGHASPPDVHGRGFLGVDHSGRPITYNMGLSDEVNESPYQFNPVDPNGKDKLYTAVELERILRPNDKDTKTLPKLWDRDVNLDASDFTSTQMRRSITFASSHLPVPSSTVDIVEIMSNRIAADAGSGGTILDTKVREMMPFEILRGGRMNVNRLWGNHQDNNSNGIVDEPSEMTAIFHPFFFIWINLESLYSSVTAYTATVPGWYQNEIGGGNPNNARSLFARQLYCVMMLLRDEGYAFPFAADAEIPDDPPAIRQELTVRRIAQWAINCVDYRDPDAIMSPFEYDVNPFNGWNVDGDPKTTDGDHADRRVVWGCEYPDVLLTETLAFHDRRMRDTEWDDHLDDDGETDHPDFATTMQGPKRIHPNDPGDGTMPGDKDLDQVRIPEGSLFFELYCARNKATNNPVQPLELYANGALDLGKMVGGYPVWRVAISRSHNNAGAGLTRFPNSPQQRRLSHPYSTLFQPNHPDPTTDVVYPAEQMSMVDPAVKLDIERYVWFSTTAPPAVSTGTFEMNDENTFYNRNDPANAQLPPGNYLVVGPRDTTYIGAQPDTDPLAPTTVDGDQSIDLTSGFVYTDAAAAAAAPANIVTPVQTMVAAINAPNHPGTGSVRGLNVSEPFPVSTAAGTPYPDPMHARESYGNGTAAGRYPDEPLDKAGGRPLTQLSATLDDTQQTQKVGNYRTLFLQRVADPLQRWNPPAPHPEHDATKPLNPYITVDWQPVDLTVFNGEDRSTFTAAQVTAYGDFDPDDPEADWEAGDAAAPAFGTRHRSASGQNLWSPTSLAQSGTARVSGDNDYFQFNLQHTLGYLNSSYGTPLAGAALGDPDNPFPWLLWPNRPFVSEMELMLVPASSPSRLCSEVTRALLTASPYLAANFDGEFGHLLNFYQYSATAGEAPHFYRILDYMEVPSRFAGTQRWFNYSLTNTLGNSEKSQYMSPFHGVTKFRDPGRVNINTIVGQPVWEAIDSNGVSGQVGFASWANIDASRRGTLDAWGRFGDPFRGSITSATATSISTSNIGRTLMRPDPDTLTGGTPGPPELPLFGPPQSPAAYNNPSANAYFQQQGIQRLGNILTTQSNVYAIWITVGYFEVDSAGNRIRELGADTGEITRHRGFYIVDRSIPVACQRGHNHNVDKTILVRRYIE